MEDEKGKLTDQYTVDVALYLKKPTGQVMKDTVISIPLNIVHRTPELAFVYLQMLGNLFINTTDGVMVYDKNQKHINTWFLTKTTQEQNINYSQTEFINTLMGVGDGGAAAIKEAISQELATDEPTVDPSKIDLAKWHPTGGKN